MTHYLRNKDNKTLVDCEVTKIDLHSSVIIDKYSSLLLYHFNNEDNWNDFIRDFQQLSEIRGSWWEHYIETDEFKSIDEFVAKRFKAVAKKWKLNYITD